MKKLFLLSIISMTLLFSCKQDVQEIGQRQGKGGIFYGGVFRMNEVQDFRNLYPLNITEVTGHRITNQIYEGLVKISQKDLTIQPSIAESWEVNEEATNFIFH